MGAGREVEYAEMQVVRTEAAEHAASKRAAYIACIQAITMRCITLLLCFLPYLATAQAPAPRTIELAVSDTLFLEPSSITYSVTAGGSMNFMGMELPYGRGQDTSNTVPLDPVLAELKAEKFNAQWAGPRGYELNAAKPQTPELLVQLRTTAELDRLMALLRKTPGISGSLKNMKYASAEPQYPAFYEELVVKARREATAVAAASGLRLGKVMGVSEVPTSLNDPYSQMMQKMMKQMPFDMFKSDEDVRKADVRTLLIRFEVE